MKPELLDSTGDAKMADEKNDGELVKELVGLGRSLGKLTARRFREWREEAREEVLGTGREVRQQVDQELDGQDEEPDA